MKEKFGKNLRCKEPTALETEVLAKVLCYNMHSNQNDVRT
jgi:hypothetical protein